MMFFMLVLLFSSPVSIDTDLQEPINPRIIAMSEAGHIYFFHKYEETVKHYDQDGRFVGNVGSKGSGPGQYNTPFDIFFHNERLYLHDYFKHRVNVYDDQGNFIRHIKQPETGIRIMKTTNGWLYLKHGNIRLERQSRLVVTESDFTNIKTLMAWDKHDSNIQPGQVNPALDICQLTASRDGETVYFYKPGSFEVFKIDVLKKSVESFIQKDWQPFPFDEAWGKERFDEIQMTLQRPHMPSFPETFQTISHLSSGPQGNVWVTRGHRPDMETVHVFDSSEGRLIYKFKQSLAQKILIWNQNTVWLQVLDEEGSLHLLRISKSAIAKNTSNNVCIIDPNLLTKKLVQRQPQ